MKSILSTRAHLLLVLLILGLTHAGIAYAGVYSTIYVKPTGNNANNGSSWALAKQTIAGAQTAVRSLTASMAGDIEVVLGEGTYLTNGSTFTFTDADSGKNGWRVIWRNEPGKKVVLSAGKKITDTWVLAGGAVYHTTLTYPFETRQLYVNGTHEFFASTDIVENDATFEADTTPGLPANSVKHYFDISTSHMPTYPAFHPIEVVVLTKWATKVSQFTSAASPVAGKTRLTPTATHFFDYRWEFSPTEKHAYFFQRSSFFTINQGFYHRPSEQIWYSKPTGVDLTTAEVIVPSDAEVLRIAGTSNTTRAHDIVFNGLNFEHANWTSPSVSTNGFIGNQAGQYMDNTGVAKMIPGGVVVLNSTEIDFEHCTFQHMGGSGLEFRAYAEQCRVAGCHFTDICGNALLMMPGDNYSEFVGRCFIGDNLIDNCGREYFDAVGLFMHFGSYNTFTHNEVKELPYTGISIGWGWGGANAAPMQDNWCYFNHIHNVMEMLKDGAGIYALDDQSDGQAAVNTWLQISQNNVHDITLQPMVTPGFGAIGIYVDQGGNHIHIERNAITAISPAPPLTDSTIFDHSLITGATKALEIVNNNVSVTQVAPNAGPIPGYDVYTPPATYTGTRDIAPLCRAYASTVYAEQYWPDRAIDQRSTTLWASGAGDTAPKFTVDFQRSHRITMIELVSRQDAVVNDGTRRNFNVYGCSGPNGTGTKTLLGSQGLTAFPQQGTWTANPTVASYQSLTVEKTDGAHFNFSALRIYSDN